MTIFLPNTSLSVGHRNTPRSIPRGYAEESEPKEAPRGREKCLPSAGWMGEAIVKPRRLRKAARRTAGTERSYLNSLDNKLGFLSEEFEDEGWLASSLSIGEDV